MISFSQFLVESRSAPLYHATTMVAAEKILSDNTLYGSVQEGGQTAGMKVIFVTRSLKHAKHYMQYSQNNRASVVFQLDQEKLTHNYKIKPIKNWSAERSDLYWDDKKTADRKKNHAPSYMTHQVGGNEFEEIIVANKVSNFSNYVTKIYANRDPNAYKHLATDERLVVE